MKKKLVFILLSLAALFIFAACSQYGQSPIGGGPDSNAPVTNNGSLVVAKGDFYYYINGKAEQSADNKFGSVVKGAIVRVEKSKLYDTAEHKVIVPKIALNSYAGSGINIFGEYIYYTSPNDEKNKEGNIEYTYLDIMRTKLDGTDTEKLMRHSSSSLQHKFYEKDGIVYFVYADTVDAVSKIYSFNCKTKQKKEIVSEYSGTAFFLTDKVVYTQNVYVRISDKEEQPDMTSKEQEEKQEEFEIAKYNKLLSCAIDSDEKTVIKKNVDYKYTINSVEEYSNGYYVFFSEAKVTAGGTNESLLKRTNDLMDIDNAILISRSNTSLTGVITMGVNDGYIVQDTNIIKWVVPNTDPTKVLNKSLASITGSTLYKVIDNTLYFFLSDGKFCSLELPNGSWIEEKNTTAWTEKKKVDILGKEAIDTMDTTWLKPTYIDGKWFFFNSAENAVEKTKEDTDHVKMFIRKGYLFVFDTQKSSDEDYVPVRIGNLSTEDKKAEEEKIKEENEARDEKNK